MLDRRATKGFYIVMSIIGVGCLYAFIKYAIQNPGVLAVIAIAVGFVIVMISIMYFLGWLYEKIFGE